MGFRLFLHLRSTFNYNIEWRIKLTRGAVGSRSRWLHAGPLVLAFIDQDYRDRSKAANALDKTDGLVIGILN